MITPAKKWHDGLVLSQVLALLLLGLSYLRIVGDSQTMAFRDRVLESLYAGPIWGTLLGYNLIKFGLALFMLHVVYGAACWIMGHISARAWPAAKTSVRQNVMLWFLLFTAGVLANNASTFAASSLGEPYAEIMTRSLLGLHLGRTILIAVLVAAAVTALLAVFRWWQLGGRLSRRAYAGIGALGVLYLATTTYGTRPDRSTNPATKPNVILIGLDSLREDLLDEQVSPGVTPHLAAFMKGGTQFTNAMTPLARTFPSMCSMLTGRHPHTSGAVMNLLPRNLINDSESLPRLLAREGYHTAYVTDEVRFANIDATYGFAQTISPPIGASEFLIEKIADAPVLNLVVNTRLGGWLFPHVHANRGASKTYDPDTFVSRVDRELQIEQPLFLVSHLTLSHWPYIWAGAPIRRADAEARWPPYYLHAARRVDQQFADIMAMLERKGLLDNTIVVVYSDHGESFSVPNEALVLDEDPLIHALGVAPQWGHGSSVLATPQFHIILGMRRYGEPWQAGRKPTAPVSFEDIAPTLVEALGVTTTADFDGRSLLGLIEGREADNQAFAGRIRFTETEYQPPSGLATMDGEVSASKVADALRVYSVDRATDRITVKESLLGELLMERHYAAIGDRHLVAAFPRKGEPGFNFVTVPLAGGAARQLLEPPPAEERELHELWSALHARFAVLLDNPQPVANAPVANRDRTITVSVKR